jgi:tetratricopeptide (TPR) repeat protein
MTIDRLLIAIVLLSLAACATLELQTEFAAGRQALIRGDSPAALGYFERVARGDPKYFSDSPLGRESIWTYVGRAQYSSGKFNDAKEALEKALSYLKDDQIARLYLGLTLLRLPVVASATSPFTLQEVSFALREGIETKRVVALVRERGVAFDVTKDNENQLRNAGADSLLVEEIKKIRAETAKRRNENQTPVAAKEIAAALTGLRDSLDYIVAKSIQGRFWDPAGEIRAQIRDGLALVSAREPDRQKILSTGEWIGKKLEEEIDHARRDEIEDLRRRSR